MNTIVNPILPGFSPDPSVCAVGEDFYLVTSTFAYFPGVPVYHSRDLVHWELLGNILERRSQLELEGARQSRGIFAPTLRWNQGRFYMITTNISGGGNFIVTADKPEGPWSEPYFLENAPGIDPSLFFDGDKCYYVGTRPSPDLRYDGDWEVWCQELELETMRLTGDSHALWKGALKDVIWPEGPHLYKIGDYYYLMIAEGGTGPDHCITIARSKEIFGEYKGNPRNPILTHRHLGMDYPVKNVGHGDLVQSADGQWFLVMLASRPCQGFCNMGRETFLARVVWEDGWPVVNPGEGRILERQTHALKPFIPVPRTNCIHFDGVLDPRLLFLRNPEENMLSLEEHPGCLRLRTLPQTMHELKPIAYAGVRQLYQDHTTATKLLFSPAGKKEEAGLAIVQSNTHHVRFVCTMGESDSELRAVSCENGDDRILAACPVASKTLWLTIRQREQELYFYFSTDGQRFTALPCTGDARILSTEAAGGFVGNTLGVYAAGSLDSRLNHADFFWLEHSPAL